MSEAKKTITKTTPKLEYDDDAYSYSGRRHDPRLCASALTDMWELPIGPHHIWITVSTHSCRHAQAVSLQHALCPCGCGCLHVSWRHDERESLLAATANSDWDTLMPSAEEWLDRHFGTILKDGKPHKFYISVEYLERSDD